MFILGVSGCSSKSARTTSPITSGVDRSGTGSPRVGSSIAMGQSEKIVSEEIGSQKNLRSINVIYFDYDSATIRSDFKEVLEAHANYLIDNISVRVVLEGHTDERGTREYNLALGESRAQAVRRQLSILGVPRSQMDLVSFGEERPDMFGLGEEVYSLNRRVEIIY